MSLIDFYGKNQMLTAIILDDITTEWSFLNSKSYHKESQYHFTSSLPHSALCFIAKVLTACEGW